MVDGVNVKDYKLDVLSSRVGVVGQRPVLFSGTIKSNLMMGEKFGQKPTEEDMARALSISRSLGPIPSIGEIIPPNT